MSYTQLILILLVLIFSALMFLQNAKNQRSGYIVCLVITIILTFVAVFKPNTMADYGNYVDIVRYNEWGRYEPATFCINTISHLFHNPFPVFIFLYAILGIGIKIKAIKELSPLFWGSIIVYLSHYYILLDLIQIRAGVAAAFSLFLIKYSTVL